MRTLEKWKKKVFQWGKADCSRFANDAVEELTGKAAISDDDHLFDSPIELREAYDSKELMALFRETLNAAGLSKSEDNPNEKGIVIVNMGAGRPALGVWDSQDLWMISSKGLRKIQGLAIMEWWTVEVKHG